MRQTDLRYGKTSDGLSVHCAPNDQEVERWPPSGLDDVVSGTQIGKLAAIQRRSQARRVQATWVIVSVQSSTYQNYE